MSDPDVHVIPIGDIYEHQESRECWCQPKVTANKQDVLQQPIIVHNSADGRELVEQHGLN